MQPLNQRNAPSSSFILASILVAALIVRVWDVWNYTFSGDEMLFLLMAKGDTLAEIWRRGLWELHPPLAHVIRHYLLALAPDTFAQRLLSIAAGLISILGIYRFGTLLRGTTMGLFFALIMAFLPVAVVTSMTIRNYAIFMAVAIWALCFFIRYQQSHTRRDLAIFTILIFLASSIHFTGFFIAAICGVHEGVRLLREKQWKPLSIYCTSYIPLTALALFFYLHYMAPGTAGPMWHDLAVKTGAIPEHGGSWDRKMTILFSQFLSPILPLMQLKVFVGEAAMQAALLAGAMFLLAIYVLAMSFTYRTDKRIFWLVITAWALAAFTTFTNLYPNAVGRHAFYFFPFFILPYGLYCHNAFARIVERRALPFVILTIACIFALTRFYTASDDEFGLKQSDFTDAKTYLNEHIKAGDAIVTGRLAAYFYLLDAHDNGKTAYDSYADAPYFNGTTLLAPFDAPWKPHMSWEPFRDTLQEQASKLPASSNIWFVSLNYKNIEQWHLVHCEAARPIIRNVFSRDGALIFSINAADFRHFLKNEAAWQQCYQGYKPLIIAEKFNTLNNNNK